MLTERDDDNDEWMYVLEKTNAAGTVDALQQCIEGRYGEAVAALVAEEASASPSSLVAHLRERTEAALLQSCDAFAAPVCTCAT
jgi:hypothetical protein